MGHKSLLLKQEVDLLMRRQGGFDAECLSLSLHLGLQSPTHVQPSAGPCLQRQNGYINVSCEGQHDGQGLRLGLPPFNNHICNEKGAHHQTMKTISEDDIDLGLCLSTQFSPYNQIKLLSEDEMKLKKQTLLYKEEENDASNIVIHDDIKNISISILSSSSNISLDGGRNNEVDSYLKNKKDYDHYKEMKSGVMREDSTSVGDKEMEENSRVDGKEMKEDSRVGGKEMQVNSGVGWQEMKEDSNLGAGGQEMMMVGCTHCFLYVLMCKDEPKCPKCGSFSLLNLKTPIDNHHYICKKQRINEICFSFIGDSTYMCSPPIL